MSDLVAVIEMIRTRIVEIDCLLDEAQSQNPGIEVEVAIRSPRNGSYVMNSGHTPGLHAVLSFKPHISVAPREKQPHRSSSDRFSGPPVRQVALGRGTATDQ